MRSPPCCPSWQQTANRDIRDGGGHVTREIPSLDSYVEEVIIAGLSEPGLLQVDRKWRFPHSGKPV